MQGVVSSKAVMKVRGNLAKRVMGTGSKEGQQINRGFMGDIQVEISKKRLENGEEQLWQQKDEKVLARIPEADEDSTCIEYPVNKDKPESIKPEISKAPRSKSKE